jgi:hypothetical protein
MLVQAHFRECISRDTYLKLLGVVCQPRFNSTLILTHLKIISSPPLKSMPSWTISPSLTGNGLDSVPGELRRIWLRNVPEELLTSRINQRPPEHQNSQWRLLTTLDLKPTGAADGTFAAGWTLLSLSDHRPTFMVSFPLGRIRDCGVNTSEGRCALGSWCAVNRIEGS